MAKKTDPIVVNFAFHQYLQSYYLSNRGTIRNHYREITKKFLDFNEEKRFLRQPQMEALEIYVFLKEYLDNQNLTQIFDDFYHKKGSFEGRQEISFDDQQSVLFDELNQSNYKQVLKEMKATSSFYPNYIYALTMGTGKTILMATCIFYEFLLANKFPKDKKYCHNVLVFAPDKTVLQSLKEIVTFDKSLVVPPEYVNWLNSNLKIHFLDDSASDLAILDGSSFNIIMQIL